ncbi:MAG: hypothetical protein WC030_00370 [Candidatus Paceibacterota bacterium]
MSRVVGLVVATLAWPVIGLLVQWVLSSAVPFGHIGDVLGVGIGTVVGGIAAYNLYFTRVVHVPMNWVGVERLLGRATGTVYGDGDFWVPPLFSLRNVPGRDIRITLLMPHEKINTQDGSLVYFGVDEGEPDKRNRILYSIVNPVAYIPVESPEDNLREAYLEQARIFFSKATTAVGVKNEKTLFSDFVVLPPLRVSGAAKKHDAMTERLEETTFSEEGTFRRAAAQNEGARLFRDEGVVEIMKNAGEFIEHAASWGIGDIHAFTPNVRVNPEAEAAASTKQAERENAESLKTRAAAVTAEAQRMQREARVTPDLAATMVYALSDKDAEAHIAHNTQNYPGIPEALVSVAKALIAAFDNKGNSSERKSK